MTAQQHEPDGEVERIVRVYRGYASSERARWYDPANPGNRAVVAERVRRMRRLLERAGLGDLRGRRLLDVGCGYGHELARMRDLGADDRDLAGVDILPDRIEAARRTYPGFDLRVADAARYDLRLDNPRNPNVRGLPAAELCRLFPGAVATLASVTLAPPLARRLGRLTPLAYPALAALRSHLIGLLHKPAPPAR